MEISQQQYKEAVEKIKTSQRILIVSHRRPDGDTLGACIAMHFALEQMNKQTTLACIDEIPRRFAFLPAAKKYVQQFDMDQFDLIIICDAGAHHMTGFHERYQDFLSNRVPIINIDHHASNEGFGAINIVDPGASCATMVVWRLFKQMPEVTINRDMALALLTGLYNDTGGMMHSNTSYESYQMASELAAHGVSIMEIVTPLFKQATLQQLKLWGYVLEHMRKNDENIVHSVVTNDVYRTIGAHSSDTGGIVDLMNTVPDAAFTMLLAEDDDLIKGSLRTQRDDVNVSDIAGRFGGGGHKKAAGFRMEGRLKREMVWRVVPA